MSTEIKVQIIWNSWSTAKLFSLFKAQTGWMGTFLQNSELSAKLACHFNYIRGTRTKLYKVLKHKMYRFPSIFLVWSGKILSNFLSGAPHHLLSIQLKEVANVFSFVPTFKSSLRLSWEMILLEKTS
jgi:hypothetical protein